MRLIEIDKASDLVTLRDNKTGKAETVTVRDPPALAKLSVKAGYYGAQCLPCPSNCSKAAVPR
jgi:hypothetical protein